MCFQQEREKAPRLSRQLLVLALPYSLKETGHSKKNRDWTRPWDSRDISNRNGPGRGRSSSTLTRDNHMQNVNIASGTLGIISGFYRVSQGTPGKMTTNYLIFGLVLVPVYVTRDSQCSSDTESQFWSHSIADARCRLFLSIWLVPSTTLTFWVPNAASPTNKQTESKPMRQTGPTGPVTYYYTTYFQLSAEIYSWRALWSS